MTARNRYLLWFTSVFVVVIAAGAAFWNMTRQEVYYLCGNFVPGVEQLNVIRQLDTATLSSYALSMTESGSTIVLSSPYNFNTFTCTIEFDKDNKVVSAIYA